MQIQFDVPNIKQFTDQIRDLPKKFKRQEAGKIMRSAARVVRNEQRRLLKQHIASNPNHHETGTLENALRNVTVRESKSGPNKVEVLIGIVRKSGPVLAPVLGSKGKKPYYWIFFEKGYFKKGANSEGHVQATFVRGKPFVGPSIPNTRSQIESVLTQGVDRFMRDAA